MTPFERVQRFVSEHRGPIETVLLAYVACVFAYYAVRHVLCPTAHFPFAHQMRRPADDDASSDSDARYATEAFRDALRPRPDAYFCDRSSGYLDGLDLFDHVTAKQDPPTAP